MNDRELMQQALAALELIDAAMPFPVAKMAIKNLRERLAQPQAMQVRPSEFVQLVKGQETLTGFPAYWAEWPNKEQP